MKTIEKNTKIYKATLYDSMGYRNAFCVKSIDTEKFESLSENTRNILSYILDYNDIVELIEDMGSATYILVNYSNNDAWYINPEFDLENFRAVTGYMVTTELTYNRI